MAQHGMHTDNGHPVLPGTTVTVDEILQELAHHASFDHLLTAHPELTHEAIGAALLFAAERLQAPAPPTAEASVSQEAIAFTPSTPFGQEMWALHQAIVAEQAAAQSPLVLEIWEALEQEVRARRGGLDQGAV